MKRKLTIIILVIFICIGISFGSIEILRSKQTNVITEYTIITDYKYITLQNDGGSHYNVYYKVNSNKGIIKKYEDHYIGFKGYEYKKKLVYSKKTNSKIKKLTKVVNDIILKEDINNPKNYSPFEIKYKNTEKVIYNQESINLIRKKLTAIDNS